MNITCKSKCLQHPAQAHSVFVFAQAVLFISQAQSYKSKSLHPMLSISILKSQGETHLHAIFYVQQISQIISSSDILVKKKNSNEKPSDSSFLMQDFQTAYRNLIIFLNPSGNSNMKPSKFNLALCSVIKCLHSRWYLVFLVVSTLQKCSK